MPSNSSVVHTGIVVLFHRAVRVGFYVAGPLDWYARDVAVLPKGRQLEEAVNGRHGLIAHNLRGETVSYPATSSHRVGVKGGRM